MSSQRPGESRSRRKAWYLLLLLPYVALLWVSSYARAGPELFGVPFFYRYQFAWVLASALLTALVYRMTG